MAKITYFTFKNTPFDEILHNQLTPKSIDKFHAYHYYIFHTQLDVYSCEYGRVTINPFALCICYYINNNLYLKFLRSNNRLSANFILKHTQNQLNQYMYDISESYNKNYSKTIDLLNQMEKNWRDAIHASENKSVSNNTTVSSEQMTAQQASEILLNYKIDFSQPNALQLCEAIGIARYALAKQIKQEPIYENNDDEQSANYWICPSCGQKHYVTKCNYFNYCSNCGQYFKW